jgi:hypothetical protein
MVLMVSFLRLEPSPQLAAVDNGTAILFEFLVRLHTQAKAQTMNIHFTLANRPR